MIKFIYEYGDLTIYAFSVLYYNNTLAICG